MDRFEIDSGTLWEAPRPCMAAVRLGHPAFPHPEKLGLRIGEGLGTGFLSPAEKKKRNRLPEPDDGLRGSKTEQERWNLVKQCFQGIGRHFFEAVYLFRYERRPGAKIRRVSGSRTLPTGQGPGKRGGFSDRPLWMLGTDGHQFRVLFRPDVRGGEAVGFSNRLKDCRGSSGK